MIKNQKKKKQLREFGIVFGLFFPLCFGLLIPLYRGHEILIWPFILGTTFFIIGLCKPYILFFPYKYWMKLGLILGWVNSRIILGLVFFFVVLPISIITKILGNDFLKTKKKNTNSYLEYNSTRVLDMDKIF